MPDFDKLPPLPKVYYGKYSEEEPDDDAPLPDVEDIDDDDDEMPETIDPALIEMLGFDPRDIEDDEPDEAPETVKNADGTMSIRDPYLDPDLAAIAEGKPANIVQELYEMQAERIANRQR
jgi:hypothetical protein